MLRTKHRRHSSAASRAFQREHRSSTSESPVNQSHIISDEAESSEVVAENVEGELSAEDLSLKHPTPDADIDELASNLSSLKFVPTSVHFGRGRRRGGLSRT